ncbi:TonB-dependent receptor domain-containing protein [Vulcaniibacterium tengchongense]|uniref:Iron complex outermembrane receptor protein n=1 Tax=Vulcaniibacterium tengchongense TaxID=1273429 RepID=A0A3N4VHG4_9GAMM|nr:TonB-dependent receptor [Vulcaniibacterium tengchongense]RPE80955.1 iron complex outermembrane receptor protein [Vulcaniibacterium tengchongense]
MSLKTTQLREAIAFALAVSATAAVGTGAAIAQEAEQETTTLDRIEVTGTRIRQVDLETAQPVLQITREDIEKQGFQSVGDILQNISATGTPPISRVAPLSSGENVGGTYISMRNLGAARTLVLLNGRRLGISTSGLADISTIPAAAVERIEVLKDGASSIYGSDAIAGVINIITRSNYEGASAGVYFGQYGEGDGTIANGSFVMGFTGDRGSVTVAAEWADEDEVWAKDRPYSKFPRSDRHPDDNWTAVHEGGGFQPRYAQRALFPQAAFGTPTATNPNPAGSRLVLRDGGDPRNPADYIRQDLNTGACAPNTVANPGPGTCTAGSPLHKANSNVQMSLRAPIERQSLFVDGIYDITDAVRFRTNLLYSHRSSTRQIAGYPMQAASFNTPMAADSYFNPTGAPIDTWWRRTWEQPRITEGELTTYRFLGAFEGSFEWADRYFDWDVSYLHNKNRSTQSTIGNLNLANVRAAVGPSFLNAQGQVQCGTAASPIPLSQCVPWNPLLGYGVAGPGSLTGNQALHDFLFQEEHNRGETSTTVFSANLSGSLFSLPAGDLGFAVGYENRKEEGEFVPDALAVTGGSTNLAAGPTRGSYKVNEVYAELQIPILADMAFARELTLDIASRFSDYDTFGETTNNKFSLKWKPFDSLLIRATHADGFRAPTINDLYGGASQTFAFYTDPCDTVRGQSTPGSTVRQNCVNGVGGNGGLGALGDTYRQLGQGFTPVGTTPAQTPVAFLSGSNPNLTPELSKSDTIGAVWSPGFLEGFSIAVDWWKIRIGDTIVADTPSNMLNDCYVLGIASRCVPSVNGAPGFSRDFTNGGIPLINFANINAGFRKVEGFDVDINYRWTTANWGEFSLSSNSTYTAKDYFVSTNTPQYAVSSVGVAGANQAHRIRSNLNLTWEMGAFGISWMARYYSGMKEACTYFTPTGAGAPNVTEPHLECNEIRWAPSGALTANGEPASYLQRRRKVGSHTFNDIQVRWEAPWNATVAIGANNVFDKQPAIMYSAPNSNFSFNGEYDIGRFLYMKYTQRF